MTFSTNVKLMFSGMMKPTQSISIHELPPGKVLDIGGGGEGIIAQAGGARVFAVDQYLSEVHEAMDKAPNTAWMVADASALPCERSSFDSATAFFSCMYMTNELKEKVFKEAWRALKPDGEFWIWDVRMLAKSELYSVRIKVELPGERKTNTMYGVRAKDQSAASMCGLLQNAGFESKIIVDGKYSYLIKAKKK